MDIFQQICELRKSGKPFVLATIVKTAGSSPRETGARMIVFPEGSISGTIGGGNFEKLVIDDCLGLFSGGSSHLLKKYRFTEKGPDSTGMSCGGEAEVFMELHGSPDRLVIFGGGHVGRALSRIADGMDFRLTVVDDRREILDEFPESIETILTDPDYKKDFPILDDRSYVVIVTKGHRNDQSVLESVLKQPRAYVGMIGSKTKVSKLRATLLGMGFEEQELDSVHAPIGMEIGAEGPEEIAVSIMAEIIAVKHKAKK